ncbi:hypothetical protein CYPRO_3330 [Cyclonatronum proteinivorum]|uniref:Uncharacterized protein n=1 Tax=Cyclonatronum proteinivorum TaxID=1457365 RepID=A0A345UQ10_9BACT|nr:hypothetical protein CYPRO_3330 [Cyclonatronum proteinivorum]
MKPVRKVILIQSQFQILILTECGTFSPFNPSLPTAIKEHDR